MIESDELSKLQAEEDAALERKIQDAVDEYHEKQCEQMIINLLKRKRKSWYEAKEERLKNV